MKVAWLSFALMMVGTLLAAAAILSGKASVLYTFYPPLRAHPAFYIGLMLTRRRFVDCLLQLVAALFRMEARTSGRKSPARRRRDFRHVHRLADRDDSGGHRR